MEKPYEYNWKQQLAYAALLAAATALAWFFTPKDGQPSGSEAPKQEAYQVMPEVFQVCGQIQGSLILFDPETKTTRKENKTIVHLRNIKSKEKKTFPVPVLKPLPDGVRFVVAAFNSKGQYILIPVKEKKGERDGT